MRVTPKAFSPGGLLALIASALWSAGYVAPDSDHKDHEKGLTGVQLKEHVLRADSVGLKQLPKSFSDSGVSRVTVDIMTGEVRSRSGRLSQDKLEYSAGTSAWLKAVEAYMSSQEGSWLGVSYKDIELDQKALLFSEKEQFLKFRVRRNGLIVQDANVDFRFKFGYLIQVVNQSFSEATEIQGAGLKDLDSLLPLPPGARGIADAGLKYRVRLNAQGKGYELIQVRSYQITDPDGKTYFAQLNTRNGEVVEYQSSERHYALKVTGEIHKRWYTEPLEARPLAHLKVGGCLHGCGRISGFSRRYGSRIKWPQR